MFVPIYDGVQCLYCGNWVRFCDPTIEEELNDPGCKPFVLVRDISVCDECGSWLQSDQYCDLEDKTNNLMNKIDLLRANACRKPKRLQLFRPKKSKNSVGQRKTVYVDPAQVCLPMIDQIFCFSCGNDDIVTFDTMDGDGPEYSPFLRFNSYGECHNCASTLSTDQFLDLEDTGKTMLKNPRLFNHNGKTFKRTMKNWYDPKIFALHPNIRKINDHRFNVDPSEAEPDMLYCYFHGVNGNYYYDDFETSHLPYFLSHYVDAVCPGYDSWYEEPTEDYIDHPMSCETIYLTEDINRSVMNKLELAKNTSKKHSGLFARIRERRQGRK